MHSKLKIYCNSNIIQEDMINILWKSNIWHEWLSQILPNAFQPTTTLNSLHLNEKLRKQKSSPKIGLSAAMSVKVHLHLKFSTLSLQLFLSIK